MPHAGVTIIFRGDRAWSPAEQTHNTRRALATARLLKLSDVLPRSSAEAPSEASLLSGYREASQRGVLASLITVSPYAPTPPALPVYVGLILGPTDAFTMDLVLKAVFA